MHRSKKKFLRNGRGPQWLSATRAESAIRRPFRSPNKTRRSQTGLEQWIAVYRFSVFQSLELETVGLRSETSPNR